MTIDEKTINYTRYSSLMCFLFKRFLSRDSQERREMNHWTCIDVFFRGWILVTRTKLVIVLIHLLQYGPTHLYILKDRQVLYNALSGLQLLVFFHARIHGYKRHIVLVSNMIDVFFFLLDSWRVTFPIALEHHLLSLKKFFFSLRSGVLRMREINIHHTSTAHTRVQDCFRQGRWSVQVWNWAHSHGQQSLGTRKFRKSSANCWTSWRDNVSLIPFIISNKWTT